MAPDDLIDAIRGRRVILFAGAGISMSLGLPSWSQLLGAAGEELGYDPKLFLTMGDMWSLAEFYELEAGSIAGLCSRMDTEWHSHDVRERVHASQIHRLIVELDFPIVYTTNYDRFLEWAFEHHGRKYHRIIGVGDLVDPGQGTQLVKYHGDFASDDTIVLTETSYFHRMDFETPLDIKLRADILGKSVLFVGYSLSDPNVRLLLFKLHEAWQHSEDPTKRLRSYLFLARPNPVEEKVWRRRGIETIVSEVDDPLEGTRLFLEGLRRPGP